MDSTFSIEKMLLEKLAYQNAENCKHKSKLERIFTSENRSANQNARNCKHKPKLAQSNKTMEISERIFTSCELILNLRARVEMIRVEICSLM